MDTDEKIKLLECKIQENFEIFNQKLNVYNEKINNIISVDGKTTKKFSFLSLDSILKFNSPINLIACFFIFGVVGFILYIGKPGFICDKVIDQHTHFYEVKVSFTKLLMYTFVISLSVIIAIILSLFIYRMKS